MTIAEAQAKIGELRRKRMFAGMTKEEAAKEGEEAARVISEAAMKVAKRHGKRARKYSVQELIDRSIGF